MNKVNLYVLDLSDKPYDASRLPLLEGKRRKNAEEAKNFLYKLRTLYSGLLLRYALKEEGEIVPPTPLNVKYNLFGKPFITDGFKNFSITHSGNLVIVAVSQSEIGVDAEIAQKKVYTHIAPKVFSEKELNEYENLFGEAKTEYFLSKWTQKEAYLKYVGTGLTKDLSSVVCENGKIKGVPVFTEKLTKGKYSYFVSVVTGDEAEINVIYVDEV